MIKTSIFILLLCSALGQSQTLQDQIYKSLDNFVEHPSLTKLNQLSDKADDFSEQTQTVREHLALVVLYSNLGYYKSEYGHLQKATTYYEKAWSVYRENRLTGFDIIEYCLKPLGNLYTKLGDFTNAESIIKLYMSMANKQNNIHQYGSGILNLSIVYHNTGKHYTAIDILEEGLAITDLKAELKVALENNLATNLMALKQFEDAESLLHHKPTVNILNLRNKAQLAALQGEFNKSLLLLEKVELQLIQNPPPARDLARFYVEKANLYEQTEDIREAKQTYQEALQILLPGNDLDSFPALDMLYAENTFISIFDGLAALEVKHEKALKYYDLSFYVSSLLYEEYIDQEVKIIHQSKWKHRTERCLEILFEQYYATQDNKYINRAFSYVEESKARVLRERTSQKSLLELHSEDTLLQKNDQLKALQENYINTYIREQFNGAKPKRLSDINDSISIVNLELKAIQDQISLNYPDSQAELVSTQDVQKVMKRDDAFLILYFLGKDNLYRFEIASNEIELYKIEITEYLNQQILSFIDYFDDSRAINNDIVGFKKNAFSLFTSIMPGLLPKDKSLLIIPDGLLHFVPFEAMLTKSSQSMSYANMPFLTQKHAVSYYTSASLYSNIKTPETDTSVLGVFPVFENTIKSLKYSIEESEQLSKRMDSKLLMHENASKQSFVDLAQDYSVIHLSTHAYSGTFTIPATLEFYDEVMLLQELYSLDLNPKLVVLSACETGVGKIQTGEGPMSLARGFQYAGAQNLLFSLWEVNDLSTSQLMSSFYKDYSGTHSALKANRKSKLDFLKNSNISNANKSPYYWSAFVYYGAIDNHDQKIIPFWIFIITGLFILLIIAMRVKFKYKKLNFSRLFRKL